MRNLSGSVGSIGFQFGQFGSPYVFQVNSCIFSYPFAFGLFAGILEEQLVGHPIQQPSLNQRHSSPVQNAPADVSVSVWCVGVGVGEQCGYSRPFS